MSYFETVKCEDEEVYYLEYHQKRIANTVGLNIDLSQYIYPISKELLKCKIIYDQDGILNVKYDKYTPREISIFKLIEDNNIEYKYKQTNRDMIDKLYKQKGIADDIIIVKDGLITDTSIANIAIFNGSHWVTPRLPLLEGTTMNRLVEENKIIRNDISIKELKRAKKVAIMNAMIGFKIIDNFGILL